MKDRGTFGVVLDAVRTRLRDGLVAPGAPLVIVELAQELRISPTPLREALARLAGEGLIEDRRGWGYCAWRPEVEDLRETYTLHRLIVGLALEAGSQSGGEPLGRLGARHGASVRQLGGASVALRLRDATEALFRALVQETCGGASNALHRSLTDRLAAVRLAEARRLPDGEKELLQLAEVLAGGSAIQAGAELDRYHDRRMIACDEIIREMRRPGP